jgi:hypothetical protein
MSLPPVFPSAPIRFRKQTGETGLIDEGSYFRDGGIADNFPINYMNEKLTGNTNAPPSPEIIGFGFADNVDLADFAANPNYKQNIPQETITNLNITPATKIRSSKLRMPETNITTSMIEVEKPRITSIQKGFIAGGKQLHGYIQTNRQATLETEIMLNYPDETIPLPILNVDSHHLDIEQPTIDALVSYGYKHTSHWINNHIQYNNAAESQETACPVALELLSRYQSLTGSHPTESDVNLLLSAICAELVKESEYFKQYMINFSEIEIDYTKNIRLNFLGNLLSKVKALCLKNQIIDEESLEHKIYDYVQQTLEQYQKLHLRIAQNRKNLFEQIDLDTDIVMERLKNGIVDTSEGSNKRFLKMFSYLLSRSYEILSSSRGEELLKLAQEHQQFKKIEHMLNVSLHNLMMLNKRFPLKSAQEYFMGYIKTYPTKKEAKEAKKNIAAMLNSLMLDSARSGNLTLEHLETFISIGFNNLGVNVATIDEEGKNVLHHCFANAKSAEATKLLVDGLQYLAKYGDDGFEKIMSCIDNYGNTPISYLNENIFFNQEIAHLVMNTPTIQHLCDAMIQKSASKGKILYAAVKSRDNIFCEFILSMLQKTDTKNNIVFNTEHDSVYLRAARDGSFSILEKLFNFALLNGNSINFSNQTVDTHGKNALHYLMEKVNKIDDANILLDFVCWGNKDFFDAKSRWLLSARDYSGKTPLHYLLDSNKKLEVINHIIDTLGKYSNNYAKATKWHLDEIIDYKVSGEPMFRADIVCPTIFDACNNLGLEFVERSIIPHLSKTAKQAFKSNKAIYETGETELHIKMKTLNSMEDANKIIMDMTENKFGNIFSGAKTIKVEQRNLLRSRDKFGKTPLHYLLENTSENKNEIVAYIIEELDKLGKNYGAGLGALSASWTVADLVDYGITDKKACVFKDLTGYNPVILSACKNFGLSFVETKIIPHLGSKVQAHFMAMREAYDVASNPDSSRKALIFSNTADLNINIDKNEDKKLTTPSSSPRGTI